MVGNPLQAGRREHEVELGRRLPARQVAVLESHVIRRVLDGLVEHRLRVVDADHLVDPELVGGQRRQLARSAAEVDTTLDGTGLDQRQQVVKRLGSLGGESAILLRVPVRHDLYCTCMHSGACQACPG